MELLELIQLVGFIFFAIIALLFIYKLLQFILVHFLSQLNVLFLFRPLKRQYKSYLLQYFPFYKGLDVKAKRRFEGRVQQFIDIKRFISRGGGKKLVSDEVKLLVAGSAVQISFGYPRFYFPHFKKILIYPNNYYSTITKQYHQGEVNVRGLIVLSEVNLKLGYKDERDGRNLGLHEMAHAFSIDNFIKNSDYRYIKSEYIQELKALAQQEAELVKSGKAEFLRAYSGRNVQEFFAVSVENFFERPQELYNYNAAIYTCISNILHQDMLKPQLSR